jgi:uncharacterized membrane protein YhaH (DUF805 family)
MDRGAIASIVIAMVAVVGVFVEIPIISDYAFWIMFAAFLVFAGTYEDARRHRRRK